MAGDDVLSAREAASGVDGEIGSGEVVVEVASGLWEMPGPS